MLTSLSSHAKQWHTRPMGRLMGQTLFFIFYLTVSRYLDAPVKAPQGLADSLVFGGWQPGLTALNAPGSVVKELDG